MEQATTTAVREQEKPRVREPLSMKALLEAGVHFGHQTRRWQPRMKRYIFTQRNGIHIIDLQQTLTRLERAAQYLSELVANGGTVLFVGTKKQAQETIENEARRCEMFYVNQRWLGGTLTNWQTIKPRIDRLDSLEQHYQRDEFRGLPKKDALRLEDELNRLRKYLRGMQGLNDAAERHLHHRPGTGEHRRGGDPEDAYPDRGPGGHRLRPLQRGSTPSQGTTTPSARSAW